MTVQKDQKREIQSASEDGSSPPTMKLAGLSIEPGTGLSGSVLDPLFINWLPQRISEQKHLVAIIKNIYQWNITRNGRVVAVWTLDLKNGNGSVYAGAPKNAHPDCSITLDEKEAVDLFEGKLDPAKAFMQGKFRISGNLMAAHKFQQFWSEELASGNGVSVKEILQSSSTASVPTSSSVEPAKHSVDDDLALLESIPTSGLKSDIAFTVAQMRMHEEPELLKAFQFVIQFNITKDGKQMATWTVDTRTEGGRVFRGPPENGKPDASVTIDDENYIKIVFEKLNPQRAFMTGKVHVKGNILLLQRLEQFYQQMKGQRSDPELPIVKDIMLDQPLIPGLRSEFVIFELIQRMVRMPKIINEDVTYQLDFLKDGKLASTWTIEFNPSTEFGVFSRGPSKSKSANCILAMEDDDFVRLVYQKMKLDDAIVKSKVKVSGNKNLVENMKKLINAPRIQAKL